MEAARARGVRHGPGEGLITDMRAVRKDYFLDHDHSAYVDQWDWEKAITRRAADARVPDRDGARDLARAEGGRGASCTSVPALADPRYPALPDELDVHPRRGRARGVARPAAQAARDALLQEHPAVFIYGIGWPLADGLPHELRAADYDDWSTETTSVDGRPMHGLNGDILVWNPSRAPARADVDGHPRDEGVARAASSTSRASSTSSTCRTTGRSSATRCRSRSAAGSASRAR